MIYYLYLNSKFNATFSRILVIKVNKNPLNELSEDYIINLAELTDSESNTTYKCYAISYNDFRPYYFNSPSEWYFTNEGFSFIEDSVCYWESKNQMSFNNIKTIEQHRRELNSAISEDIFNEIVSYEVP